MYVPPNKRQPGLKALRQQAQARAQVAAEVAAAKERSERAAAARKIAGQ